MTETSRFPRILVILSGRSNVDTVPEWAWQLPRQGWRTFLCYDPPHRLEYLPGEIEMTDSFDALKAVYILFFQSHGWLPRGKTPSRDELAVLCNQLYDSELRGYRDSPQDRLAQSM